LTALEQYDGDIKRERRKREYTLPQIAKVVEKQFNLAIPDLRSSVKQQRVMQRRRAFSLVAQAYGYRGREIAAYLSKEPSSLMKYIRSEEGKTEVEKS
jgi:chromosomal replication initiation ATPase DnaA